MSHVVTNGDLDNMRRGIASLTGRLAGWSAMIEKIRSSTQYIPTNTGHDGDFKGFSPGNKVVLERRMTDTLKLANQIKVNAADLVLDIQAVLDTSRASQPFDAAKGAGSTQIRWQGCADTYDWERGGGADSNQMRRLDSLHELSRLYKCVEDIKALQVDCERKIGTMGGNRVT